MTESAADQPMQVDEVAQGDAAPSMDNGTAENETATTSNGQADDDTKTVDKEKLENPLGLLSVEELAASAPLNIIGTMPELEQTGDVRLLIN